MPIKIALKKTWESLVAKEAMEAVEQVTNEMGAEIHDDLMQRLTVFRFYFDRMETELEDPKRLALLLAEMKAEFQEVSQSVRTVSRQLMPANMAQETFSKSIHLLCLSLERPGTGHIHFEKSGNERTLSDQAQNYLARMVQELIHNAFKHSAAWHIWVRMTWSTKNLMIEVEDDGTGINESTQAINRLMGKYNTLKRRSQAIGAEIKYEQGTNGLLALINYPIKRL